MPPAYIVSLTRV